MALGSTQSLTEMSTRNIFWGAKVAGAWGWQLYHLHKPIVMKSGSFMACTSTAIPLPLQRGEELCQMSSVHFWYCT